MADQAEAQIARDKEKSASGDENKKPPKSGDQPSERKKSDGKTRVITFKKYYEVLPDQPLPELSTPTSPAYAARDKGTGDAMFVLLCDKAVPPRISRFSGYQAVTSINLMQMIDSGPIKWGTDGHERYAILFRRQGRRRWFSSPTDKRPMLYGEELMGHVVKPLIRLMTDLRNADIIHGTINAFNIYETGRGESSGIVLGECVSAPPSYNQPVLFETIERGMAMPSGRGLGGFSDDLYSLGVTLACLAMGRIPMAGFSDEEILKHKIEKGSYASLIGREKMPEGMTELLRGLLNDDPRHRWQMDDLIKWSGGRRLSPKQSQRETKASRPYDFLGTQYWRARELALALPHDVARAATEITSDKVTVWVKRSLSEREKELQDRLATAISTANDSGRGPSYNDRLVAYVCMALDPRGPIRYSGVSVFPGGFGTALCEVMAKGGDVQPFAEIVNGKMAAFWMDVQPDVPPDTVFVMNRFDNAAGYLRQNLPGYGVERIMYYLAQDAPCMSPALEKFYVTSGADLLRAFEEMSGWKERPRRFLDRHSIAFLMARERAVIENQINLLSAYDPAFVFVGTLSVFADIQRRDEVGPLPGLSAWLAEYTPVMLERIHNRRLREKLRARVKRVVNEGDLEKMLILVDDLNLLQNDQKEFLRARKEYEDKKNEIQRRMNELKYNRDKIGLSTGREVSVIVSGVLAGIAILGTLLLGLTGGG